MHLYQAVGAEWSAVCALIGFFFTSHTKQSKSKAETLRKWLTKLKAAINLAITVLALVSFSFYVIVFKLQISSNLFFIFPYLPFVLMGG